jgi:anti-sigma factor ChrR (cupin superfamily)
MTPHSHAFHLGAVLAEPDRLPWQPLRPGVEIHRLYGAEHEGPSAALLRYRPGAEVPWHVHTGAEHILVLSGSQEDHRGRYGAGSFVVNQPGTRHRVVSPDGCLVLVVWERPVRFELTEDGTPDPAPREPHPA